jgi:CelD/BcsL family acetyltransferase involved in cellulose biosynthesis
MGTVYPIRSAELAAGPLPVAAGSLRRTAHEHWVDSLGLTIEVHDRFETIREAWLGFQESHEVSAFHSFDWCRSFWNSLVESSDRELAIVTGVDAKGELAFLMPLSLRRILGIRIAEIIGDTNSAHRGPIIRSDIATLIDKPALRELGRVIGAVTRCDVLFLEHQPRTMFGAPHPWYSAAAVDHCDVIADTVLTKPWAEYFAAHTSKRFRGRVKKLEATLAELGPVELYVPEAEEERLALLDQVIELKAAWLRSRGVRSLDSDETRQFLRALTMLDPSSSKTYGQLHALRVGGEVVAASMGVMHDRTFSGIILVVPDGPVKKLSPGAFLMSRMLEQAMEAGVRRFSFGLGESDLKVRWTDETMPIFSTAVPLTAKGRVAAVAAMTLWRLKAESKKRKAVFDALSSVRPYVDKLWPKQRS